MTADIELQVLGLWVPVVLWIGGQLDPVLLKNDSVHAVHGSWLRGVREELFTPDCTCDDVADEGISLRQVRRKIHLFPEQNCGSFKAVNSPLVALFDAQPWKAKVRANRVCSHKVDLSV